MSTPEEIKKKFNYDFVGSFPIKSTRTSKLDSVVLIVASQNRKEFHILPNGEPAYSERYDWVGSFSEGLAVVNIKNEYFHILPNGEPAYSERYDWACSFSNGIAQVQKDNKWINILPNGVIV